MKSKIARRYVSAKHRSNKRIKKQPYILPVIGILFGFLIIGIVVVFDKPRSFVPSDAHVVYVNDNGNTDVLPTKAQTVGELLSKMQLKLAENDVVEPSLDTQIFDDNFRINVYRAEPVTIIDGSNQITSLVAEKTPRLSAEKAGVKVYPEDEVSFERGSVEENIIGAKVLIKRAKAVNFNLYGTQAEVRTHKGTVGEFLKEKNVVLAEGDSVAPSSETALYPGIQVFVIRSGTQIQSVEEAINFPTKTVEDSSLTFGTTVTRQPGVLGKRLVTYQINLQNGVEVGRTIIQEVRIQEPVERIIARGKAVSISEDKSALMTSAGIPLDQQAYANYIISRESGWCPTKWQGQVGYCPGYYQETYSPTSSRGYGLCQSTPAIKMASAGADWKTNPVTQLRWCTSYANSRYGSWYGAYEFWTDRHWW